jgi:hypothetical protein
VVGVSCGAEASGRNARSVIQDLYGSVITMIALIGARDDRVTTTAVGTPRPTHPVSPRWMNDLGLSPSDLT